MDGLVQIQLVVQGNVAVGLMGLDTQGRVWYGELSGAKTPARYSISRRGRSGRRIPSGGILLSWATNHQNFR